MFLVEFSYRRCMYNLREEKCGKKHIFVLKCCQNDQNISRGLFETISAFSLLKIFIIFSGNSFNSRWDDTKTRRFVSSRGSQNLDENWLRRGNKVVSLHLFLLFFIQIIFRKQNPTLATAAVFFHRFHMVHSFQEYPGAVSFSKNRKENKILFRSQHWHVFF